MKQRCSASHCSVATVAAAIEEVVVRTPLCQFARITTLATKSGAPHLGHILSLLSLLHDSACVGRQSTVLPRGVGAVMVCTCGQAATYPVSFVASPSGAPHSLLTRITVVSLPPVLKQSISYQFTTAPVAAIA